MNADDGDGYVRSLHSALVTANRVIERAKWKRILLFLGVSSLILASCREATNLYFYTNQTWTVESALTVDKAFIDLFMGVGGAAVGSELGIPIPGSILQSDNWIGLSYDWMVGNYRNMGLDADWRQRSNTYILTIKGGDFSSLPGVRERLIVLEPVADGQYHLHMETLTLGGEMGDLGEFKAMSDQLSMFGFGYERVVTLHAGRIVSSNADEVRGGKAIWRNPTTVDVTFVPASPFPTPLVISVTCLLSLVGTAFLAMKGKIGGTKCPTCGKHAPSGQDVCSNCGEYMGSFG